MNQTPTFSWTLTLNMLLNADLNLVQGTTDNPRELFTLEELIAKAQ